MSAPGAASWMLLARLSAAKKALAAVLVLVLALVGVVWSACKKTPGAGPVAVVSSSAPVINRLAVAPDAGPSALRDVAIWSTARDGLAEDLASLATHEGAAGLMEAADEPTLRATALRAMGYARGWAQLPFLAVVAAGADEEAATLALDAVVDLASRPRRSEDVEDEAELREGCEKLGALARDTARARGRRIPAVRALRMMPCPKEDLPSDLDAR